MESMSGTQKFALWLIAFAVILGLGIYAVRNTTVVAVQYSVEQPVAQPANGYANLPAPSGGEADALIQVPAPDAKPVTTTINYTQYDPGKVTVLPGYSFNTGELTFGGKKYQNVSGRVLYFVNDSDKAQEIVTVGGGMADSVDVNRLVLTELTGGCGMGCPEVMVIYASGKTPVVYTQADKTKLGQ